MREAGQITDAARQAAGKLVEPGITTREIDNEVRKVIKSLGAKPSFLGLYGFPAACCCSVNDEVIHGIPGNRKILEGDIVKIDVGAFYGGFHGDCAATFAADTISEEAKKLIEVTRQSFYEVSGTPGRATEFPIFLTPFRSTMKNMVTLWCASMSGTA